MLWELLEHLAAPAQQVRIAALMRGRLVLLDDHVRNQQ